jgi:nucleoside permease NupC
MWGAWSFILTALFVLMVYRGTLTIHEEDQLFLGDVAQASYEHAVQEDVLKKLNRVEPFIKVFSGASAVATVILVGYYVINALGVISHHVS